LFVRGSASAAAINSITPKPRLVRFPAALQTLQLDRQHFTITAAAPPCIDGPGAVLRDAMHRYETLLFVGSQARDDRAASMAATRSHGVASLVVSVVDGAAELKHGVSEAYNLSISVKVSSSNQSNCWSLSGA
jgi:hypothetical protein